LFRCNAGRNRQIGAAKLAPHTRLRKYSRLQTRSQDRARIPRFG
jgi:hypothetical protein